MGTSTNYLYGDSTKSPLNSNFLEFLRDAIDFSVGVLHAEDAIRRGRAHVAELRREADDEIARLEAFVSTVIRAIDNAPKGDAEKVTAQTAAHLRALGQDVLAASIESIRQKLASDVAEADAAEAVQRMGCVKALETMLLPHDPPEARNVTQIARGEGDVCTASVVGQTGFGLSWQLALAVPAAHVWATPMRPERLVKQLSIKAPQLAGWISKELKTRSQRLERHLVSELVDDGTSVGFKLREESDPRSGFDVDVDLQHSTATIARVGSSGDKQDASLGSFELDAEDTAKMVELAEKLRATTEGLERRALVSATFGDVTFADQDFSVVVGRLVETMTPLTREIAERSLMPNELVIRRLLGGDRREEIFVTKQSLRDKYGTLPQPFSALFTPLGLDPTPTRKRSEAPPADPIVVRSELPPSIPPPAPAATEVGANA